MPCARSGRQETLSRTTKFSTFSLHLNLPPVHPTPTTPNSFSLLHVLKHAPSPTHPNPSSLRSCTSPHFFLRLEDGSTMRPISRRSCIPLRASRTTSSVTYIPDDESPLAFHDSTFDPRQAAIKFFILKCMRTVSYKPNVI